MAVGLRISSTKEFGRKETTRERQSERQWQRARGRDRRQTVDGGDARWWCLADKRRKKGCWMARGRDPTREIIAGYGMSGTAARGATAGRQTAAV